MVATYKIKSFGINDEKPRYQKRQPKDQRNWNYEGKSLLQSVKIPGIISRQEFTQLTSNKDAKRPAGSCDHDGSPIRIRAESIHIAYPFGTTACKCVCIYRQFSFLIISLPSSGNGVSEKENTCTKYYYEKTCVFHTGSIFSHFSIGTYCFFLRLPVPLEAATCRLEEPR